MFCRLRKCGSVTMQMLNDDRLLYREEKDGKKVQQYFKPHQPSYGGFSNIFEWQISDAYQLMRLGKLYVRVESAK